MVNYIVWLKYGEVITGETSQKQAYKLLLAYNKRQKGIYHLVDTTGEVLINMKYIISVGINAVETTTKIGY